MKELPKIYHNTKKEFKNNKEVYLSYDNKSSNNISDIKEKIINILNSPNFIYRTKVYIKMDNQIITKKIIGLKNDYLLTIDNELMPINKIQDIYK